MKTPRELAVMYFSAAHIENTPYNWHIFKRAFDLGYSEGQKKKPEVEKPVSVIKLKRSYPV